MSDTVIKAPHLVVLENGQTFTTKAHIVSTDRLGDGVDWLYFETIESHVPTVTDAQRYHDWDCGDFRLYAWLVPMSQVMKVSEDVNENL